MSQMLENAVSLALAWKMLEALVVDNPDLERLEALLDQFNIFEAIGTVRQEVRHSDFLAFLLNPQQNHGLGDTFLKRLLQRALSLGESGDVPVTPIDLDIWSLNQALVLREWQNIDILVVDEAHRLALIIENKIDTSEHSNQLQRYRKMVDEQYPGWRVVGLYLTPDGEEPSDARYLSADYGLVCQVLEGLAQSRASTLGPDVLTAIKHYTQMLRRHIVAESEIAELCRRIYQKHQRALDLIYEHRPDRQASTRDMLQEIINYHNSGLLGLGSFKRYINFMPQEWDVPALVAENGEHILMFQFNNQPDRLKLFLIICPGPPATRQRLFDVALSKQPPFKPVNKSLRNYWNTIYSQDFLRAKSYEDTSDEEIREEVKKHWSLFVEHDLPQIRAAVRAEAWIWEHPNLPDVVNQ